MTQEPGRHAFSLKAVGVFQLASLSWIFFRAATLESALAMLNTVLSIPSGLFSGMLSPTRTIAVLLVPFAGLAIYSWLTGARRRLEAFEPAGPLHAFAYGSAMACVLTLLAAFGAPVAEFIYFQF
jgi:hypothetical protein